MPISCVKLKLELSKSFQINCKCYKTMADKLDDVTQHAYTVLRIGFYQISGEHCSVYEAHAFRKKWFLSQKDIFVKFYIF